MLPSAELLQDALRLSEECGPLEQKLHEAKKDGTIGSSYLGYQIEEAEKAGLISAAEAARMQVYHEKVQALMAVDDFAPDEIGRSGKAMGTVMATSDGRMYRNRRETVPKATPRLIIKSTRSQKPSL